MIDYRSLLESELLALQAELVALLHLPGELFFSASFELVNGKWVRRDQREGM